MFVAVHQGVVLVSTPFDDKYDLIQKFRGIGLGESIRYNQPVDFMESGLMQRDKWDYWHIDVPFALNTDEAVPARINNSYIGGNHGYSSAVSVYAPAHGKTVADVGSLWKDESGNLFTLLRIEDADRLLFLSENLGSVTEYRFVTAIEGKLSYVENGSHRKSILPKSWQRANLTRTIRHKEKKVVAIVDGKEITVYQKTDCDYAEIREEYEIINPATVAESLRNARPRGGYKSQPDLADFGQAMLSCKLIYRIIEDGTVLTIFDYEKRMDVRFEYFFGVMYQEKIDVYRGGIYRYLPKTLPYLMQEHSFDFSKRVNIFNTPYPNGKLTSEYWADKNSPCDRVVDYFCDEKGKDRLAFSCGYLPVLDGKPSVRSKGIQSAVMLTSTRKHYPVFAEGDLTHVRGVAYKKYFSPQKQRASLYDVVFDGKKYIFADFFEANELKIPVKNQPNVLEQSEGISHQWQNGELKILGERGFAVFITQV